MRITCPNCQFKGLIDTAPLAFETRVACVRCGITFDAMMVEGEIRTSMPQADENLPSQAIAPDSSAAEAMPSHAPAENVLALPQTADVSEQAGEQAPVLEDVLTVSAVEVETVASDGVLANQAEERMEESAVSVEADETRSPDDAHETDESEADERSFDFGQSQVDAAADYERQSMGTRLMRLSPLWLLVCGLTFVGVIILSNQFARPAEHEQRVATNYTSPDNKATNQALVQPTVPAATNSTATSVQDFQQTAAPAPVEVKSEAKLVEEKTETRVSDEPKPLVAPAAEKKSEPVAPVAPVVQSQGEAGGITVQVGSYNVIEQANERLARLQSAGFDARVVAVELPKRGTWYRVQAGRFANREEATRYGNEMKSKGAADNFIVAEAEK